MFRCASRGPASIMALMKMTVTAYSPIRLIGVLSIVVMAAVMLHFSYRRPSVSKAPALPRLDRLPDQPLLALSKNDHTQIIFQRLVHLDLKGAPLSLAYFRQVFPLLKDLGVTGLLVEYEDMFPYWGDLATLAHPVSYNRSNIAELLELASAQNFTVIPLVQSFGHLEFVLKHDKWKHLRAQADSEKGINPSVNESLTLLTSMVDQLLELHPGAAYIHIGGDEVYTLGQSRETKARMRDYNLSRDEIYLLHLTYLAKYIKRKRPNMMSIFWDDMIRHIPLEMLKKFQLAQTLEPMLWGYTPTLHNRFPDSLWKKYAGIFPNIWLASSFKGATGQAQYITNVDHHLKNHKAWVELINKYTGLFNSIRGITLTGWQRYDHNLPLCELFPVGIPSLAVNLRTLVAGHWDEKLWLETTKVLQCDGLLELQTSPTNQGYHACRFPGSEVYDAVHEIHKCITKLNKLQKDSNLYFVKGKVSKKLLTKDSIEGILRDLRVVQKALDGLHHGLPGVLQGILLHDVEEWMQLNVYRHEKQVSQLLTTAETAKLQLG